MRPQSVYPDNEQGFTLLEVMLAACILSIMALAVAGVFVNVMDSQAGGWEKTVATGLAQDKLEELKAVPVYALESKQTSIPVPFEDFPAYTFTVYVQPFQEVPGLREVSVTVYYQVKGNLKEVSLVTLMGER